MIDDHHHCQIVLDGTRIAVTHRGLHVEEAIDKTRWPRERDLKVAGSESTRDLCPQFTDAHS